MQTGYGEMEEGGDMTNNNKTIREQLEEIVEAICTDYCRYPRDWDAEQDGELSESDICANCPLGRLV